MNLFPILFSYVYFNRRKLKEAIKRSELPLGQFSNQVLVIETKLKEVRIELFGDPIKSKLDIDQPQTPMGRLGIIGYEQKNNELVNRCVIRRIPVWF